MAGVKTAISVKKTLFDHANKVAAELNISRSRLFSLAIEDYIKKLENRNLLDELNAVYEDSSTYSEEKTTQVMKRKQKHIHTLEPW